MAKQKTIVRYYPSTKKRSYRRSKSRKKHRTSRQIPILKTLGIVGSALVNAPDRTSPFISWKNAIQDPSWGYHNAVADTMVNYTGYDFRFGTWHLPMGLVSIVLGSLASKIAGKFAGSKPFRGIPFASRLKF